MNGRWTVRQVWGWWVALAPGCDYFNEPDCPHGSDDFGPGVWQWERAMRHADRMARRQA